MNKDIVKFAKVKEDAVIPSKRKGDMGYDIYACFENEYIEIKSGEIVSVPTGIASALPDKYGFVIKERGSTGSIGVSMRCGIIDSSYRGEWFITVNNTTNKTIVIAKHPEDFDKETLIIHPAKNAIAQAILIGVPDIKISEISYNELKAIPSERGVGKLGSSGK